MFSCSFLRGDKKELVVFVKTSCRFCENEPLFVWKQAVAFMKTRRCLCENKPSFLWKQAVVFMKTSRCFCENQPSFLWKRAVVFVRTSRRLGMSVVLFCRKSSSDFLGKAMKDWTVWRFSLLFIVVEGGSDKPCALKKIQGKMSFCLFYAPSGNGCV